MEVIVMPLIGIEINNKKVFFGMDKYEVQNILGRVEESDSKLYYWDLELRIDLDEDGRVEFIEFLGGIEGRVKPIIYGVNAFEVLANELLDILILNNKGKIDDTEKEEYCHTFFNISVGVYREQTPEDIRIMREEQKKAGIYERMREDTERDAMKAEHWSAIGIGHEGYYK